jgi:hypothetical protein
VPSKTEALEGFVLGRKKSPKVLFWGGKNRRRFCSGEEKIAEGFVPGSECSLNNVEGFATLLHKFEDFVAGISTTNAIVFPYSSYERSHY